MKFFITISIVLLISSNISAHPVTQTQETTPTPAQETNENQSTEEILARRGCCSHHNGVCGCSGKRQLCCDGTLSPSCQCEDGEPL